jgi:hypothetical protein
MNLIAFHKTKIKLKYDPFYGSDIDLTEGHGNTPKQAYYYYYL